MSADSFSLRLLVPSRVASLVIGKKGETVRDLTARHSCKIHIPESKAPERVLTITGAREDTMSLLEDICNSFQSKMREREGLMYANDSRAPKPSERPDDVGVDIRLLVHRQQAGAVIGTKGSTVKKLREIPGLSVMKVYEATCPNSMERVVQIVGEVNAVKLCVQEVINLLDDNPAPKGPKRDYHTDNYDMACLLSYGGWFPDNDIEIHLRSGRQNFSNGSSDRGGPRDAPAYGAPPRRGQYDMPPQTGHPAYYPPPPGDHYPMEDPYYNPGGYGLPPAGPYEQQEGMIMDDYMMMRRQGGMMHDPHMQYGMGPYRAEPMPPYGMRRDNPMAGGPRMRSRSPPRGRGGPPSARNLTSEIQVPTQAVGALMGNKGTRIREVEARHEVNINVDRTVQNGLQTITVKAANPHQLADAERSIHACIEMHRDK